MPVTLPVVAVVPTFTPPESTAALLRTLGSQLGRVLLSDDASPCTSDPLLRAWDSLPNVEVIRHDRNRGIARGLNDGLHAAQETGAEWLLTIDQDTVVPQDYVERMLTFVDAWHESGQPLGAIGAQHVVDASGALAYPLRDGAGGPITEEIIQTGSMWNVRALTRIGGFDESLGIDAVDAAACLALRQRGYLMAVAPEVRIEHTIGTSQVVRIAGRSIMVTGHSPARRTSMLRNRLRLFPAEFRQSPRHAIRTVRRVAVNQSLGLAAESGRWEKLKGSIRGLAGRSKDNLQP